MSATAIVATLLLLPACGGRTAPASPTSAVPPGGTDAAPLRDAARGAGKLVGAAVQSGLLRDPRYAAVLARHFNYLTAEYEMKWDAIEHVRGSSDFSAGDAIVTYGQSNAMEIKGHALIWHRSLPPWIDALSASELRAALQDHIRSVAAHFRGRVRAWDVVNEAIADDGSGLRNTVFREKLGDDYIAEAFRIARQADPTALLFYNDYNGEGLGQKSDQIFDLVQRLRTQGVPIDGVGLQMHINAANPPAAADVAENMRRLASVGLRVNISEMDVRVRDVAGTPQARLDVQKSVYQSIVSVCVAEPRCDGVTFWGFTDAHSWIDGTFGPDDPLLFDEQYAPKPAFYGVLDAFLRRPAV